MVETGPYIMCCAYCLLEECKVVENPYPDVQHANALCLEDTSSRHLCGWFALAVLIFDKTRHRRYNQDCPAGVYAYYFLHRVRNKRCLPTCY